MKPTEKELERLTLEKIRNYEERLAIVKRLPHRYSQKHYAWSREFFESTNKTCFLTAANQIGKSTVQIKKCIEWAVNKSLWPKLWPHKIPRLFWYLYPSKDLATIEWETKWLPLMPDRDDPEYGWEVKKLNGKIDSIKFKTGILLVFNTYTMDVQNLQAGTVDALFCDEELPYEIYPELTTRLSASRGYFSMVFTATLGQEEWRQTMEATDAERAQGKERFPKALKRQISLFDCMYFEDGTPSHFSADYIQEIIARCGTQNEVLKRVYGRFVKTGGKKYESFDHQFNVCDPVKIEKEWLWFAGIDYGAGGKNEDRDKKCDPSAIVILTVSPDYQRAYVTDAWRGDEVITTADDVVQKFLSMRGGRKFENVYYDYAAKDLHTIASRMGEEFVKADKSHDRGEGTLNALFKNHLLTLFNNSEGLQKLAHELSNLSGRATRREMDHLCDALRYACAKISWDWSILKNPEKTLDEPSDYTDAKRQRGEGDAREEYQYEIEDEFEEFNALCEG